MPIVKHALTRRVKMFTKKDFEDGKCTKEGLPLDKEPEGQILPASELPQDPVEETPQENAPKDPVEETEDGDNSDSEESPDNSD